MSHQVPHVGATSPQADSHTVPPVAGQADFIGRMVSTIENMFTANLSGTGSFTESIKTVASCTKGVFTSIGSAISNNRKFAAAIVLGIGGLFVTALRIDGLQLLSGQGQQFMREMFSSEAERQFRSGVNDIFAAATSAATEGISRANQWATAHQAPPTV